MVVVVLPYFPMALIRDMASLMAAAMVALSLLTLKMLYLLMVLDPMVLLLFQLVLVVG